jgi:DNA adenine methylase
VYKNIQSHHEGLYDEIQEIIKEFTSSGEDSENESSKTFEPKNYVEAKLSRHNYYYWVREKYNQLSSLEKRTLLGSAMFIFLNKTCFRGVFREGPNGFNVPYGHYSNPEIVNKEHLDKIHFLIAGVVFQAMDFEASLNEVSSNEDDFVYLDPPYAPETTKSFVSYTKVGFDLLQHKKLFDMCQAVKKRFMMSNADVTLVRDYFAPDTYSVHSITCKRAINSKNPDSKTKEVIIKNY